MRKLLTALLAFISLTCQGGGQSDYSQPGGNKYLMPLPLTPTSVTAFGATCSATNILFLVTNATGSSSITWGAVGNWSGLQGQTPTAADVGKTIVIWQEGGMTPGGTNVHLNAQNYSGIITGVGTGNLSIFPTPTNGYSNTFAIYGWDDTAAIQAGINQITNGSTWLFQPGPSIIAGPIIDPSATNGPHKNAQLYIPDIAATNNPNGPAVSGEFAGIRNCVLRISGPWAARDRQFHATETNLNANLNFIGGAWISACTNFGGGSMFTCSVTNVSLAQYNNNDPRWSGLAGGNTVAIYANAVSVELDQMTFTVSPHANGVAMDLSGAGEAKVTGCTIDCGYPLYACPPSMPQETNTIGLFMPQASSAGDSYIHDTRVTGFALGIAPGEHIDGKVCLYDDLCAVWPTGGHCAPMVYDAENCAIYFTSNWRNYPGLVAGVWAFVTTENAAGIQTWASPAQLLMQDTNSALRGMIVVENGSSNAPIRSVGGLRVETTTYSTTTYSQHDNITITNGFLNGTITLNSGFLWTASGMPSGWADLTPNAGDANMSQIWRDTSGNGTWNWGQYFNTAGHGSGSYDIAFQSYGLSGRPSVLDLQTNGNVNVLSNLVVGYNGGSALIFGNGLNLTNITGLSISSGALAKSNSFAATLSKTNFIYAVPAGQTNQYLVSGLIDITARSLATVIVNVQFTDENNVVQTVALDSSLSAVGYDPFPTQSILAKTGNILVFATVTLNAGSITYDLSTSLSPPQ